MVLGLLVAPEPNSFLPAHLARIPIEVPQCFLLLAGMLLYVVPRLRQCRGRGCGHGLSQESAHPTPVTASAMGPPTRAAGFRAASATDSLLSYWGPPAPLGRNAIRPAVRQDSKKPVQPPSLAAKGFAEQVDELLAQITPTPVCDQVVQDLAQTVKDLIRKHWPSASVLGVVSGEISQCTSFGVAVPEVDIIVKLRSQDLAWPLQARLSRSGTSASKTDVRKLQKSAIRVCTDVLVSEGGFKFRRSAFRGKEPKVTLMAPRALGLAEKNIPIDFSVNASTPLCNAGLLAEIDRLEPRARALALLVRRWAKDRGICHAAKGHLPPYAWTLLTIYYLQTGMEGSPLLPPLAQLKIPVSTGTSIWASQDDAPPVRPDVPKALKKSVGQLFKEFIRFYVESVDWKAEAVCVRLGQRLPPDASLPLLSFPRPDGGCEIAPAIEDPFMPNQNIAQCLTVIGFERMSEELRRAQALIESDESLTKLLHPWVPPDQRPGVQGSRDQDEEDDEDKDAEGGAWKAEGNAVSLTAPPGLQQLPPGLELSADPVEAVASLPTPSVAPVHPWTRHKLRAASM